jgi:RHS repeat-associated protein
VGSTPWGFGEGYTDPTGLIYLVNRYYDPATGQFLSVDPKVSVTRQPYEYASNNPVVYNDPMGEQWVCAVMVDNVSEYLYVLSSSAVQICSGDDYEPEKVCDSIWRNRWWGGQRVADDECSDYSDSAVSGTAVAYVCQNHTSEYDYYAIAHGYAEDGAYSQLVQSGDTIRFKCG